MQVTGKGCFRIFRFSESPLFQLYFRWQFVVSFVQQAVHCQRKKRRRPQQKVQFEKGNCRKQQGEKRTEKVPHETFFTESNLRQIHYRNALDVGQRGQFFRLRKQREGAVYVKKLHVDKIFRHSLRSSFPPVAKQDEMFAVVSFGLHNGLLQLVGGKVFPLKTQRYKVFFLSCGKQTVVVYLFRCHSVKSK